MKKLLLLLILSFFSAQSFAGSCPDGSEPVKSISADGTYFVYNCGNKTNNDVTSKSESSTIGQSIYKTITQGDAEIYEAQMLLNRFNSYPVVSPNGQWTSDTQSAIKNFYQNLGQKFDGKWSSQILSDLKIRRLITMPRSGPLSFAEEDEVLDEIRLKYDDVSKFSKDWYQLNQLKFTVVTSDEVSGPFCYPTPEDCVDGSGIYTPEPSNAARGDFNGDGLEDLAIAWNYFIHTTHREKTPAHVRFYLNDGNNNLISSPDIYALGEVPLRHMLYRMTVNDFNSDGRDDLFVGSMGVNMRVKGQKRNLNDFEPNILLLSTQNGQMEDASHLIEGQENGGMIKDYAFSHATTSGDINCDGFIDIYSGNALLIGDGTGRFTHQSKDLPQGIYSHQKANSFASTIADFNGDGCGDVAMHLQDRTINVWMSNYGKHMPRTFKELKMENYYGKGNTKVNHMVSGDLDGDGDPDLVGAITQVDPYYKGRKIVIFINEGGELIEKTESLIQDDRDQIEWAGEGSIHLVDHDRDGDLDIIDSTDGSYEQNGPIGIRIFENDGTGHFTKIPQSEFVILREDMFHGYQYNLPQLGWGYPIDIDGVGRLDYVSFMRSPPSLRIDNISFYGTQFGYTVLGRDKPIKHTQEELKKIEREFRKLESEDSKRLQALNKIRQANHPFSKALSSLDETRFEGESVFNAFSSPIPLYTPGAAIMGYKDLKRDNNTVMARLHLQFMGNNVSTNVCIQYYLDIDFMGAKLSFFSNDWGGIKGIKNFGTSMCNGWPRYLGEWEIGSNSAAMAELGMDAVIKDVQLDVMIILEAFDEFEAELEAKLVEENKSSPLFDGRYRFNLFRYEDDEGSMKIGNGFVEIRNGEVIIEKDNRELTTGSTDLYDAFSGQVNKNGKVSASMTLDVLNGIDAPEFYEFDGSIKDKKIWGETAFKNSFKAYMLIAEENKSSPLFDGRYSFNLFLYHDDEDWKELGNGFIEISNGELIIDKDNSELKTGPTDLYDTFSSQIDEKGNISGSVELAYLFGKDRTEVFTLNGQIDNKIWGDSPREDFFRVYMLLVKE